jgi:peptidyl-dipeptidase Dcp
MMAHPDSLPANPLLDPWQTPHGIAPFAQITAAHIPPAFEKALAEHADEIVRIAEQPEPASFENTILALERSGELLKKVSAVFWNLTSADTNPDLQAIERDMAPRLARHWNAMYLNEKLFSRIDALHAKRQDLGLDAQSLRLLERMHVWFLRAGAQLDSQSKARIAALAERLASLGTAFAQSVLADEKDWLLLLETPEDLAGLPETLIAAAAKAAEERGHPGKHAVTLSRSSIEPFLQFSSNPDLRRRAHQAWIARGQNGNSNDTRSIIGETLALRQEKARLLGFADFASFKLSDTMAGTPQAVRALLEKVWEPACTAVARERQALQRIAENEGRNTPIEASDWRYYAEKHRKATHDIDESEIKPYLVLDRMIEAAFDVAGQLFGLCFALRPDITAYHPDVRVWEVTKADGAHIGLFLGDYFARPSKRSGAWMSAYRGQENLRGRIRPIIVNVMNFAKAADGEPCLLSFDDAQTLFHEFGHGLHGLLSDVTYPSLSGTSVARDFVEFPSQLYEHWLSQPAILNKHARHYRSGAAMPQALIDKLLTARRAGQGLATVEYAASALVDLEFHTRPEAVTMDPVAFEAESLARIGMPQDVVMRHRSPHFLHVFSGEGYAAGYYSYLWSEVLDADGFAAFEEKGDIFHPETARRLHDYVYAAGNSRDPALAYQAFRGRRPDPEELMKKRGFQDAA